MKRVWIAVDCRMVESSGIGRYIRVILPELCKKYRVTTLGRKDAIAKYSWFREVEHIELKYGIYNPLEQLELAFKIPAADIFWSPHFTVPVLPIRAGKRVVTVHDMFHLRHWEEFSLLGVKYIKLLFKRVANSDRIITGSRFSRKEILELTSVAEEKLSLIGYGVDQDKFVKSGIQSEEFLKDLPDNYLLYIGNVKPHKNLKTLLAAFKGVSKNFEDTYLVIGGKKEGFINGDEEIGEIISRDENLKKKVVFTGFVPEAHLPDLYRKAKMLVFPSLYEGFGLPPVEAMACGIPVVASNVASIPEVCGKGALYFDPLNIEDIANKIEMILKDPHKFKANIDEGFRIVEALRWELTIEEHIKLFDEIVIT